MNAPVLSLNRWITERASQKTSEALDFAKANGRGVTGLRRVLQALETGEVQSIFAIEKVFRAER